MTAPELKPCPFCGATASYSVTSDEGQRNDYDTAACSVCPAEMRRILHWADKGGENKADLLSAWNRRADLAAVPARDTTWDQYLAECHCPQPDPRDEVIARLVEALEWYADEVMAYAITQASEPRSAVHGDKGKRARKALAAAKAVQHD